MKDAAGEAGGGSLLTRDEQAYLRPGLIEVDAGWLYPQGMAETLAPWMAAWEQDLEGGAERTRLAPVYARQLEAMMRAWIRAGEVVTEAKLTPTCSQAFQIAVAALTRPGDKVIVADQSYDSSQFLRDGGRVPLYLPRAPGGYLDPDLLPGAIAGGAKAIILVSPDNPSGHVTPAHVLATIAGLCARHDVALIADHALATLNPARLPLPTLPPIALACQPPLRRWAAMTDSGKVLHLGHSKFGLLAYPPQMATRVEDAASLHFAGYSEHDLAMLQTILYDPRFRLYQTELNTRIGAHHRYLAERLAPAGLRVLPLQAGSGTLIDTSGLAVRDGAEFARLLRDDYQTLVIPVSHFPPARPGPLVRAALPRPFPVIKDLATRLRDAAVQAR